MTPFLQEGGLNAAHSQSKSNSTTKSLIYRSRIMDEMIKVVHKVSALKTPVLISGESGVGKKLLAQQIHTKSTRYHGPLVSLYCGSLTPQVLETELFGYKGDDITPSTEGALRTADGGTLVLDEITKMPASVQEKFQSFLKMGAVTPVGSHQSIPINVRLIYTTSEEEQFTKSVFNQSYNQIKIVRIGIPKLSQRREDIPDLVRYFLSLDLVQSGNKANKKLHVTDQAMDALKCYKWPGNVQELKDICERLQVFCTNHEVTVKDLPRQILDTDECVVQVSYDPTLTLSDINRLYILSALKHFPSKKRAAKALGITVKTLYNRLHEYGVFERYAIHAEAEKII